MTTALFTHPDCLDHVNPTGHPEQVARLPAILARLDGPEFANLDRQEARLGNIDDVLLAHPRRYYDRIAAAIPEAGHAMLDGDTYLSSGSLTAALRGVGAVTGAVDRVLSGAARNAFCATRPPGHHAERETAMGFCLFGNVAIAAKHAIARHALSRVAILDFDVHHGNGTQDLVWNDPNIFFASTHQMPLYPGTGYASETGGSNNVLNVPLAGGTGGDGLIAAFEENILPAARTFAPEMVILSAGFDAHADDPLAGLNVETADFAALSEIICQFASEACDGRLVSVLEGGYDLAALADAVAAHITVLMEQAP
jgi:acetoin utilization deacetylase AcuC-like enzyme